MYRSHGNSHCTCFDDFCHPATSLNNSDLSGEKTFLLVQQERETNVRSVEPEEF